MWAVWIALLLWAAPTQGVSTHCEIPAVEKLQNTSLTCKFSKDISKLKQDFKVQFYKSNTTDLTEVILDCFWVDDKPECTVHKCCEYDGHVNETLRLRILSVTEARVGRYVCFVLPAAPDSYTFCNFTLTEKQTDTPGSNPATIAVPVVIVIAVIICIIIIVWKLKCSKKAEDKSMKKKTCQFWPVQRYSKEKETVDGKLNEVKQSLIECKVEENDSGQSANIPDSKDRSTEKDLQSTDPTTAEKLDQKSDNNDRTHVPVHTRIMGRIATFFDILFRREQVNRNAEPTSTLQMKNEPHNTSVTGTETKPEEIKKSQTGVDQSSVSGVTNEKALNKQGLSESGTNRDVSSSGSNATIPQSQQMQNPPKGSDSIPHKSLSEQNDVIISIADQKSDDDTRSTRKTSHTLCENELQTINETKDQKTQKSDKYNYTTDIRTEGKKAKRVRKAAEKKEKGEQEKAENDEKIAKDKAEKEIKSAREKAEKEEKLVKENAEKEEATAKGKADELEKIAKDKAEREERMVNEKAKEEEKIAKDKAEKEEGIAKRTSKKMANTVANLEESVKKISNEKEEQMTKITKNKEQQMEIIAKEKDKQLEKIAKENREELEKIANARKKQLQLISKRKTEEIEKIKKSKEEEIEKIRKVKKERIQTIIKEKEEKIETIYKKKEEKRKKKGKENKQTAVIKSHEVQRNDEQLKINEIEDDNYEVEHSDETEPCLDTNNSSVQVNPAIRSQSAPHTIVQMSELASHQDTSKAPTGTQEQTLQAEDKVGNPIKNKTNEDKASNKNASTERNCTVS